MGGARQPHGRLGDEAERALGADEQVAQVIAGGVFYQIFVELQDFAAARDHGESRHPVTGHPVANHLDATGVGREVPSELARPRRGEIHRVEKAFLLGELLELTSDDPGLTVYGAIGRAEREDPVHGIEGDHDLAVGRDGAGAQTGATSGGHETHAMLVGEVHDGLHLLGGLGEDNGRGRGLVELRPVFAEVSSRFVVDQDLAWVDQGV